MRNKIRQTSRNNGALEGNSPGVDITVLFYQERKVYFSSLVVYNIHKTHPQLATSTLKSWNIPITFKKGRGAWTGF